MLAAPGVTWAPEIASRLLVRRWVRRPLRRLRYLRQRRMVSSVARRVREDDLTYLSWERLRTLERWVARVQGEGVPGDLVEAGVALGGSGIVMAAALDGRRGYVGYDRFAMIPPPSERDGRRSHERYRTIVSGASPGIGGAIYYGYVPDLLKRVVESFARFGGPGRR